MHRNILPGVSVVTIFLIAALLGGCGSGNKEGGQAITPTDLANATHLGDLNCLQCHNAGKDLTMNNDLDTRTIGAVWQNSLHNGDVNGTQTVHCEDCHGGGQFHWGLGPLANPVPGVAVCSTCHGKAGFKAAPHANANQIPDSVYSQIPTAVSQGKHIEECSVCHNANQRFVLDASGNLLKPDPANLPLPVVACANCHDAHQPGNVYYKKFSQISTARYQIFRKVQVNTNGANDANAGTWVRPMLFVDPATPTPGKSLNHEVLCGSCHSNEGTYMNSGGPTHNDNIYGQWKNSVHADPTAAAFSEFADGGGEHISYPVDLTNPGVRNRQNSGTAPSTNICLQCHNGIASDIFQGGNQGTVKAGDSAIIWGDSHVTCLTCHSVHGAGTDGKAVKNPAVMTSYSASYLTIKGKFFLDGQALPPAATLGNSAICIFCHQGRESGLSLYKAKLAPGATITGNFFNPHYLGTAAMLWGANGYEFAGRSYGVNAAHQSANCVTCHMDNPTTDNLAGGHTWERNVASCNTCHNSFGPIPAVAGTVTPDLSTYRATFDTNNYSGDAGGATQSIAVAIQSLENKLVTQLQLNGAFYNDLAYPYFFTSAAFTTPLTAWTPAVYKAAFNLSYVVKGLPSSTVSQLTVPNGSAATHDHIYNIELLQDSIANLIPGATLNPTTNVWSGTGGVIDGAFRPIGSRPATVYGVGQ